MWGNPPTEDPSPSPSSPPLQENMMENMPCHQMGGMWMGNCEKDDSGNIIPPTVEVGNTFSTEIAGLPRTEPSLEVVLKNGDVYEMTAEMVQQTVGNTTIKRLAYNRQIPGPRLIVEQGATITLQLTNSLEIPTTLHSHGIRLSDAFDGVPLQMMGKQKEILPGESFLYTLTFPDAGVFWYHPHMREDYTQEMGMYGNFFVTPKDPAYFGKVDREEFLMIDDFAKSIPFFKDYTDHSLMGRYGDIFLINNQDDFQITAKRGEKIRFYITNTANTRVFDLQIDGGAMKLVGGDNGRIEKEEKIDHLILGPAERAIVEIQFEDDGIFPVLHRGKTLGQITVLPEDLHSVEMLSFSENTSDYAAIRDQFADLLKKPADKKLKIGMEMNGMGHMEGMNHDMMGMMNGGVADDGIEWEDNMGMMNAMSTDQNTKWILEDTETGEENMDIQWKFQKGSLVKIEIFNDPKGMHPMQHPIHFHGQRFVVLSIDGKPNENLQWKDTVLIPSGKTVTLAVEMNNVGSWMAHCHIAEHLHAGMMFHFEVE